MKNPLDPTPLTLELVKGLKKNTQDVFKYVLALLKFIGATGPFQIHVVKKIPGSEHHHGAKFQRIQYGKVRYLVQTGDGDTRFVCDISSPEMRASDIVGLIQSKIVLSEYFNKDAMQKPKPIARDINLVGLGEKLEAASVVVKPKVRTTLAGGADDQEIVMMIINGLRYRHGIESFTAKSFFEVVQAELDRDATSFVSGQFLRRITDNGYFVSEGRTGQKTYRLTEKGLGLLLENDKFVVESAKSALHITDSKDLHPGLAAVEAKARQHARATRLLADLNAEIKEADTWVAEMQKELEEGMAERELLRGKALVQRAVTENPDLVSARRLYDEFQARLKGKV